MIDFQIWLVALFARATAVRTLMHAPWVWGAAETIHFIGLSLLFGGIFLFDLRLLGVGNRIPIAAVHRFIPLGLLGFGLALASGVLFVMAEPDQYVYNPAFHFKILFMVMAGLNAGVFYLTSYRRAVAAGAPIDATRLSKVIAVASLSLWLGVLVSGRLLTFYRPWPCGADNPPGVLAWCLPGYDEQGR